MKKVLIITSRSFPSVGGVEKVVDQLAMGLSERGYEVRLLTNIYRTKKGGIRSLGEFLRQSWYKHFKGALGFGYRYNNYTVVETYFIFIGLSMVRSLLSPVFFPITLIHFIYQVMIFKPDVINLHFADNSAIYGILCKVLFKEARLITSLHGSDVVGFPNRSNVQKSLLNILVGISDKVIFVSRFLKEEAEKLLSASIQNSIVIHNSTPSAISIEGVVRDANRILFVGRIVKNKGVDILLQAFEILGKKYPDLELLVVGDGAEFDRLKSDYSNKNIQFMGFITEASEVARLYLTSSIFVAPSRFESFGKVALEAMSYRCAVITSDIGGFKEVVTDGKTGILFKSENVDSLVSSVERILENSTLRNQLAVNGARDVDIRFSEKIFLDNYENSIR